jgi:hypothetical protein
VGDVVILSDVCILPFYKSTGFKQLFNYASRPTSISALILVLCSSQACNIMSIVAKELVKSRRACLIPDNSLVYG